MKRIEDFIVLSHRWLNYKTFIIELEAQEEILPFGPGSFAEIRIDNSPKVFLRRPFSIYDVNRKNGTMSFFVKVIGEGTRLMGEARKGDTMNVIYPLGNSFTVLGNKRVLVVGGGSGIAPFLLLGKELQAAGTRTTFLFGGKTAEDIVLNDLFSAYGEVLVTTEDGTLGEKGLVTGHSVLRDGGQGFDMIYACGPEPMMMAVASIASRQEIPCEVSLENTMACGFGACLCCIVPTVDGNKCVCTEGPVFNIKKLKWQI